MAVIVGVTSVEVVVVVVVAVVVVDADAAVKVMASETGLDALPAESRNLAYTVFAPTPEVNVQALEVA